MALPRLRHIEAQDPKYTEFRKRSLNMLYIAGALALVGALLSGLIGIIFAIFAAAWVIVNTQLYIYHRTQIENFQHYREVEALLSLHQLIDIRQPLPPMRLWSASPDFINLIAATIIRRKPQTIVDLGTGASTLVAAYALEGNGSGHITSLEHLEEFAEANRVQLKRHALEDYATVIEAPISSDNDVNQPWYRLDKLPDLPPIDLLIVDGPPEDTSQEARYPALPLLYDKLAEGAIILVDDYIRKTEHSTVNRWLDDYGLEVVETIANEKGAAILRKRAGASSSEAMLTPRPEHSDIS